VKRRHLFTASACAAAAGAAPAQTPTYLIDPTHTFVVFEVDHGGLSTLRGRFDRKQGSVRFDRAARTGSADITIDLASVSTGVPALDRQLKGADFFGVEGAPNARFVAEAFTFNGDRVSAVPGQLTLRGQTQPITLTATNFNCYGHPMLLRQVCGGDFEATIARSAWGLGPPAGTAWPDRVRLLVQIEAIKQ
jgi:polyisoprenoid-binding protein YceI